MAFDRLAVTLRYGNDYARWNYEGRETVAVANSQNTECNRTNAIVVNQSDSTQDDMTSNCSHLAVTSFTVSSKLVEIFGTQTRKT